RPASTVRACSRHPLPRLDGDGKPIRRWRERTDPLRVESARWVIREVEIEDKLIAHRAEVRALGGVEQIASAAVGALSGRGVAERKEHAARVGVEPEDLER